MRGPVGKGKVKASVGGELAVRGTLTFAVAPNDRRARRARPVTITGLGTYVPERVVTNDELSELVDTSDEWIATRTGIRQRRVAAERRRCPIWRSPPRGKRWRTPGVAPRTST